MIALHYLIAKNKKKKQAVAITSPSLCAVLPWATSTFLIPDLPLFCCCHGYCYQFGTSVKLDFKAALTVIAQAYMH